MKTYIQNLIGISFIFLIYACTQITTPVTPPAVCPPCNCSSSPSPTASVPPTATAKPSNSPTPTPAPNLLPFFIIGVDVPSEDLLFGCPKAADITLDKLTPDQMTGCSMAKWKLRGINTVVRVPQGHDVNKWEYNAWQNGLKVIREPQTDLTLDAKDPNLLAFELGDEPDLHSIPIGVLPAKAKTLKIAAPSKLIFVNVSGGDLLGRKNYPYADYFNAADIVSHDIYPVTGWNMPDWIDLQTTGNNHWNAGSAIDAIRKIAPSNALQLAYIETSNQGLSWVPNERAVTQDEFRGEIWDAIIHGADGIIYFPEVIQPWNFDGTGKDVAIEMVKQNQLISKLSDILLSPKTGIANQPIPFELAERVYKNSHYRFLLNFSHLPHSYLGADAPHSDFAAYEMKIYKDNQPYNP